LSIRYPPPTVGDAWYSCYTAGTEVKKSSSWRKGFVDNPNDMGMHGLPYCYDEDAQVTQWERPKEYDFPDEADTVVGESERADALAADEARRYARWLSGDMYGQNAATGAVDRCVQILTVRFKARVYSEKEREREKKKFVRRRRFLPQR